ncbi:hypothetical protein SISNIDRAFT_491823 [Sistotremastrum niveocremeum HHB9708]|uniref:Uncharacterized protein n=1 Tax=Sistotremastrum niveocremeum HHB9708 TaxID=1314777 RepID=A0A164MCS5_9AGAM|nr:hypothetical protein SISNIDRAFT_491823 [Sistotremastrum niveocremeum HHB9708]
MDVDHGPPCSTSESSRYPLGTRAPVNEPISSNRSPFTEDPFARRLFSLTAIVCNRMSQQFTATEDQLLDTAVNAETLDELLESLAADSRAYSYYQGLPTNSMDYIRDRVTHETREVQFSVLLTLAVISGYFWTWIWIIVVGMILSAIVSTRARNAGTP